MIYGYCRVSTDIQDGSVEAQHAAITAYCDKTDQPLAHIYVDEDVSGSIPLRDRPQGKAMWDRLGQGDMVVITTRDRAFRSLVDAASTLMAWREQGIKLHILDFPIDLTTDEGEMVFLQGAVFSQYERKAIGRRIRRGLKHLRDTGKPYCGARPLGWIQKSKEIGGKTVRWWEPLESERRTGDKMLALRREGRSWSAIALACADEQKVGVKRKRFCYYHVSDVRRMVRAAEAGYPKIPQSFWLTLGYEQKLHAMRSDAPLIFS